MHRSGFAKVGQLKLRKEVSMSTKEKWKRHLLRPNRISYRYVLGASPEKMLMKNLSRRRQKRPLVVFFTPREK